jgi:hypothetical protein
MATAAGKFEVANNLLQQGMLSNPKKYFMLLEGAPLKTLFQRQRRSTRQIGDQPQATPLT